MVLRYYSVYLSILDISQYVHTVYKSVSIYTKLGVRNMLKLNLSGLKFIGREIKALVNVFGTSKQSNGRSDARSGEIEYYIADSRRRKNYIECHATMLYGFLCYEYREDGTISVV